MHGSRCCFSALAPLAANYYLNFALSVIALIAAMLVSLSLYAPASDKFLASIAESNSIPVSLKAEVAKFLKENGSISMRELYLIDEKYVAEQEKSKEGYLKMLSFIEFDDAQKQQDSKEGVES